MTKADEQYAKGKFDVLEEFYELSYLSDKGIDFYNGIKNLEKSGWFKK